MLRYLKGPWPPLVGILLGLGLGTYTPDAVAPVVDAFKQGVDLLAPAAPYIILFSILAALLQLFDIGGGGKAPVLVVLLFTCTTVIAGLFAILVGWPIFQLPISGQETGGILDALSEVAANLGTSGAMIAVIWAFLAAGILHLIRKIDRSGYPDEGESLLHRTAGAIAYFGRETARVFEWIGGPGIRYIGTFFEYALPFILFAAGAFVPAAVRDASAQVLAEGGDVVQVDPALMYLGTAALIALVSGVYLLAVAVLATRLSGTSLRKALTDYLPPTYSFAWATASSTLTIPINLEAASEGLEARESTREFVIPLGATINLDGTMIGAMLITPVTAAALGLDLTLTQLVATFIPLVLVTVGAPGIPGGLSILAPPILSTILGLSGDIQTAFIGVWFAFSFGLTDQFRTAANSTNNGFLCLIVDWMLDKAGVSRIEADAETLEAAGASVEATAEAA